MAEGLVVAAGKSQRTGDQYKMTLDLGGQTLIETTVASLAPWCERIIVVTGHNRELIESIFSANPQVVVINNPDYQEGMFSSIKTGLPFIQAERFFFLPGDIPLVAMEVFQKMLAVDAEVVVPVYKQRRGHPVLFRQTAIDKILNSGDITNLRDFIATQSPYLLEVDCPGISFDLDTLDDYRQALKLISEGEPGE